MRSKPNRNPGVRLEPPYDQASPWKLVAAVEETVVNAKTAQALHQTCQIPVGVNGLKPVDPARVHQVIQQGYPLSNKARRILGVT